MPSLPNLLKELVLGYSKEDQQKKNHKVEYLGFHI